MPATCCTPATSSAIAPGHATDPAAEAPAAKCNKVAFAGRGTYTARMPDHRHTFATSPAGAIARAGGRVTRMRLRVLALLQATERPLTHQEIGSRLHGASTPDRVTLYRVLDWLVRAGLAHCVIGHDRVRRFAAPAPDRHAQAHAHFHCERCQRITCAPTRASLPRVRLPAGYRLRQAELTLHGLCPACVANPR